MDYLCGDTGLECYNVYRNMDANYPRIPNTVKSIVTKYNHVYSLKQDDVRRLLLY